MGHYKKILMIVVLLLLLVLASVLCCCFFPVSRNKIENKLEKVCRRFDRMMMEEEKMYHSVYENGFIYDDTTLARLQEMIANMHTEFAESETDLTYYSPYQAVGHYAEFYGIPGTIAEICARIDSGENYEKLLHDYREVLQEQKKDMLIVMEPKMLYSYSNSWDFHKNRNLASFDLQYRRIEVKSSWTRAEIKGYNTSQITLETYYFTSNFQKWPLPERYAQFIHYSQFMIGDEPVLLLAPKTAKYFKQKIWQHLQVLQDSLESFEDLPLDMWYDNPAKYKEMWLAREKEIDKLKQDQDFITMLDELSDAAFEGNFSNNVLEYLVARCISREKALKMKRCRKVWGGCSRDSRPAEHSRNIAILAAQNCDSDLFLRAHLDILNDYFPRIIDSGYGSRYRASHVDELKATGLRTEDLLFGIALAVENPGQHHYFGNLWRIGRAFATIKEQDEFKTQLLSMIEDEELDPYNRIRMHSIYYNCLNFIHFPKKIDDMPEKETVEHLLKQIFTTLPFE